jgi:hypothetical protein
MSENTAMLSKISQFRSADGASNKSWSFAPLGTTPIYVPCREGAKLQAKKAVGFFSTALGRLGFVQLQPLNGLQYIAPPPPPFHNQLYKQFNYAFLFIFLWDRSVRTKIFYLFYFLILGRTSFRKTFSYINKRSFL